MAKKVVAAKKSTVKKVTEKKTKPTLGEVVMVYTKTSSHWYALTQAAIVEIEDIKFVCGTQVTGKTGHRMEGKKTLIPLEHVGSIVEFASEDELWSEPQQRFVRPVEETRQSVLLTSHEQQAHEGQPNSGPNKPQHHGHQGHHKGHRHKWNGPNSQGRR